VIRHDAHNDYEIFGEHGPEDPDFQGMDFPLPVQGNQSPNILALGMLAKISFVFGIFMLLIRLIGLSHPDIAVILSYVFAAAFAIALGIKLFAPNRGMMEWPVWIGAAIVLFFAVNRWLPVLDVPVRQNAGSQNVIPILLQLGIILLVIVIYLSPSVRNLLTTKTPGPLAVGAVGCLLGGRCAALDYFPESDFGAWIYFAMMLLIAWTVINCVTGAHPEAAVTPIYFDTDREVIDTALSTIGLTPPEQARIVRIKNTLQIEEVDVSETCRGEFEGRSDVEVLGPGNELGFDPTGNLLPFGSGV